MENETEPSTGTTLFNISNVTLMHEYQELIEKLNYERMLFQLPVIVTLLVVMVVAIFGNILVICVYRMTYKSSVASFFITLLAIVDLSTTLCISFNIQDMFNPYMNPLPVVCKIGRFLESFVTIMSGNFLLCVAFDRYFHIIYPLRRYTFQQAKALAIVMTAVALCMSWPQLFLAGMKTVETHVKGIYGEDCSFRDDVDNSIYTLLFQGVLMATFFIGMFVLIIFYGRIYFVIWRRLRCTIGERVYVSPNGKRRKCQIQLELLKGRASNESTESTEVSVDIGNNNDSTSIEIRDGPSEEKDRPLMLSDKMETSDSSNDLELHRSLKHETKRRISDIPRKSNKTRNIQSGTSRTTRIMAIITVFAIIGFLPYLLVNLFKNMGLFFRPGMSTAEDLIYEFCTKSHFINSFVNPIIYSVMNPIFRRNAWKTVKTIGQICCLKLNNS
ncbi:5-hydroxytryptamine receptor 1D-like [Gigantopelta aegis]|uniref:5-hydroxytryptamine receptor 1D-like n=1 Tax=Gigantopelta aegis TaxID=1735272 RepID=UPI001B88C0C0|nr:5-hydroxytryptamine receptor 1D-like [Gigantopelta aegis]